MKYRPEIDGLRALAVLPVMIFHAGFSGLSGGFIGVDIFFVISGYLITSIIFKEIESSQFSFINFYERRARRILPALYFVLISCLPLAWFFLIPQDYVDFSKSLMGVVGFISNIVFWLQFDYFSASAEYLPLLHTWSLAIEEQYYFFFPILLILLYRKSTKAIWIGLACILLLSLLASYFGSIHKPSASYYLLPTRLWELLIGSLIALFIRYKAPMIEAYSSNTKNILSLLGLGLIIFSLFAIDKSMRFPGLLALLPTLGAGLIILFARQGTYAYNFLSRPILVSIGLISYSAYLWHQPIYAFIRHQSLIPNNAFTMSFGFFTSLILAFISWKYIEAPFRNKSKTSRKFVFTFTLLMSAAILFIGWAGISQQGFKDRFSLHPALTEKTFDLPTTENGWCFYSVDTNHQLAIGKEGQSCTLGEASSQLNGILFGDSYAGMYEPFWDIVGKENSLKVNSVTTNWCYPSFSKNFYWQFETPALEQCLSNRAYVQDQLKDIDFIILSAVWSFLPQPNFNETLKLIADLSKNADIKVIIMAEPKQFTRASVMRAIYLNGKLEPNRSGETKAFARNKTLQAKADLYKNVIFIERKDLFKAQNKNEEGYDSLGLPYSLDGGHISIYGSQKVAENFMQQGRAIKLKQFLNTSIGIPNKD